MQLALLLQESLRHEFAVDRTHVVVGLVAAAATFLCVLLHYEAMSFASSFVRKLRVARRMRVFLLVQAMLVAHVIEVWIFALTYWVLEGYPALGVIEGAFDEGALDLVYFSVVNFTTVGFGDLVPVGAIRILAGTEAAGHVTCSW